MEPSVFHTTVAVIGGGFSGLSAALKLHRNGVNTLVIEARDRVGGRSYSPTLPSGCVADLGAGYIGPLQNRLYRLADEFGVETYKVETAGKNVLITANGRSVYEGDIPSFNPLALLDFNAAVLRHYQLTANFPYEKPWESPSLAKFDHMSANELVDSICWTDLIRTMVKRAITTLTCVEPTEISALYWLWMCRQGDGFQRLVQVNNGAQERKFVTGSQSVAVAIAKELGERVILNHPVQSIQWKPEGGVRIVCCNGITIHADRVIVALAPTLYSTIRFEPQLPPLKNQLGQHMAMGSIIKTITYYRTAWWRELGFSGSLFSESGPIIYSINDTKSDGSYPAIMGFILANNCRELLNKTKEERQRLVTQQYSKAFQSLAALEPISYEEHNWCAEQYSGGCYLASFPPEIITQYGSELRTSTGPIHFAGTELATRWAGYMEGAIQSGERAAHEILTVLANDGVVSSPGVFDEEEVTQPQHVSPTADPEAWMWYLPSYPTAIGCLAVGTVMLAAIAVNRYSQWW